MICRLVQITIVQNLEPFILQWIKITDFDAGVSPFQLAKLQLEGFSIGPWTLRLDREETAARCPLPLKEEVRAIANLAAKGTSVDDAVSHCSFSSELDGVSVFSDLREASVTFLTVHHNTCRHPT